MFISDCTEYTVTYTYCDIKNAKMMHYVATLFALGILWSNSGCSHSLYLSHSKAEVQGSDGSGCALNPKPTPSDLTAVTLDYELFAGLGASGLWSQHFSPSTPLQCGCEASNG